MAHFQSLTHCPFEKANLITQFDKKGAYDTFVCSACNATGKRYGLQNEVMLASKPKCPKTVGKELPKQVRIKNDLDTLQFGLKKGEVHNVVDSPQNHLRNWVWVYSEKRKEPVRLLEHEYEAV